MFRVPTDEPYRETRPDLTPSSGLRKLLEDRLRKERGYPYTFRYRTDRLPVTVQNEDFREYQDRHGRGGDFIIYSDVKVFPMSHLVILR